MKVKSVVLTDKKTGDTRKIETDGVFLQLEEVPNSQLAEKAGIKTNEKGYIVIDEKALTNIEGVFASGDVVDSRYRQAITAAGSGCQAAIDAERYLEEYEG